MSPRTIMTGKTIDYNVHFKYEFGQYIQTREEYDNTMQTHTVGSNALRPIGNVQGGNFYLSLVTDRILNRINVTPLPISQEIIDRVHSLARDNPTGLEFRNRSNEMIIKIETDNKSTIGNNYSSTLNDVDDNDISTDNIPDGPVHTCTLPGSPIAGVNDDENNNTDSDKDDETIDTNGEINDENNDIDGDENDENNDES